MAIKTIGVSVIGAAAIGLSVNVNTAAAATFNFSYTFLSGASISGTVEGDLQPDNNTVRNLSRLSATYSEQPGTLLSFLATFPTQFFTLSGTSSFSFFGFANNPDTAINQPNFGFYLGNPFTTNGATVGTFATSSMVIGFPFNENRREAEPFAASRWVATANSTAAVPEPTTMTGLALAGIGLAALRRRRQRPKTT